MVNDKKRSDRERYESLFIKEIENDRPFKEAVESLIQAGAGKSLAWDIAQTFWAKIYTLQKHYGVVSHEEIAERLGLTKRFVRNIFSN